MIAADLLSRPKPVARTVRSWFGPVGSLMRGVRGWLPAMVALLVLLVVLRGTAPIYDTRLPPPTGRETYAEVTPVAVAGAERAFEPIAGLGDGAQGARVRYGDKALLEIARLPSQHAIDRYVATELQPRLQRYEWHDSHRAIDGWQFRADGAIGRLYGWQNQDWLFVIEAVSEAVLNEIVDQFAYIRRR